MLNITFQGLKLIPSRSAGEELLKYGLMIEDCKEILEKGYDAPRKRAKDTIEKWMDVGNKTFNVVVVVSYNYMNKEDVYLITHVGKFTKKKIGGRK